MDSKKVDQVAQAAVNAAISELGDDKLNALVIVIVRPLRAGEELNVTTNAAKGHSHHHAVAAILGDARAAVERGGSRVVEPVKRVLIS